MDANYAEFRLYSGTWTITGKQESGYVIFKKKIIGYIRKQVEKHGKTEDES